MYSKPLNFTDAMIFETKIRKKSKEDNKKFY